jgi:hypothetical protein
LEAGTFGHGHGNGKEILAAGRDEVERGLDRIEGRQTATSATGHDQERGVGDGTGVVPGGHDLNTNTPQARATAGSRADPISGNDRDVADTGYIGDRGNPGTAANGTHGPSPEQCHGEKIAATAPPRDPLGVGDGPVQPNTVVRQGNVMAPSDPGTGRETRATAGASYPADAAG